MWNTIASRRSVLEQSAVGFGWLACVVTISWCVWRWVETPLRVYFSRPITGHPGGGRGPVPEAVSPSSVP